MKRLCAATLGGLPAEVHRPSYDLARVAVGVVHLGVGNFHRAHQAIVFDDLLATGDPRWGVCGVSLRRPAMRDALAPQDGLYAVLERDGGGTRVRVPGALREQLVASESASAVIARLADPATRLVTLTITEKGYDETGPGSAVGLLANGLAARHATGAGGLSLLSCDNLAGNGRRLHERLLGAVAHDARLANWVGQAVRCPDTMVDRIVPATTDADRADAAARLGLADAWPVPAEPFMQWVVEDRFVGEPPPWAAVGVQVVDDVAQWEAMKLRLLNAAHSALAYLGAPAGVGTVDQAIADPRLRGFVLRLWAQATDTLPRGVRGEAPGYTARLLGRFANPALRHRLLQIAMDGSRKLPQRLVAPLHEARMAGRPHDALLWAVAAWMHFVADPDERGAPLPLDDPLAAVLRESVAGGTEPTRVVRSLLARPEVFPPAWEPDEALVGALSRALQAIRSRGALASVDPAAMAAALSSDAS